VNGNPAEWWNQSTPPELTTVPLACGHEAKVATGSILFNGDPGAPVFCPTCNDDRQLPVKMQAFLYDYDEDPA